MFNKIDMLFFLPPPYGGVSVHVQRLVDYLKKAGIRTRTYRYQEESLSGAEDEYLLPQHIGKRFLPAGLSWLKRIGLKDSFDLVHCHYSISWSYAINKLRLKGIPCVQTIHNSTAPFELERSHILTRLAFKSLVRDDAMQWIAVSDSIAEQLVGLGIRDKQISVIPAFIPPDYSVILPLPSDIQAFIETHSPLLSIYAFSYFPNEPEKEIYRLDDALYALEILKRKYTNIGLIICVPNRESFDFAEVINKKVVSMRLSDSVFIMNKPIEDAWRIWAVSDIFLRPTSKDGDAVAIREALAFGTRVIASDAVVRPEKVRLYPTGNISAMIAEIEENLYQPKLQAENNNENIDKILTIYDRVTS